jgi:hypothetical protein
METAAPAVTTVDSATTQTPEFNPDLQSTWSGEQRDHWNRTGERPLPKKSDSATDKTAVPDSAPDGKDKKPAVSASESATDKDTQKPNLKTKEDTERRIQELLDRAKRAEERAEAAERKTAPERRESEQKPQPAPEQYQPLDDKKWFAEHPTRPDGTKTEYGDFIRASARHEAQWEAKQQIAQAIAGERQRLAQEAATKEFTAKVDDAKQRYGAEEVGKIFPAIDAVLQDKQIPLAFKAMLNDSDVLVDLMYTLRSDDAAWAELLALAKSNPGLAIRKLVTTEALVQERLKQKAGQPAKDTPRGEDGKFTAPDKKDEKKEAPDKPNPRAPKPVSEVGGRGAASDDPAHAAARSGNFGEFSKVMEQRARASRA